MKSYPIAFHAAAWGTDHFEPAVEEIADLGYAGIEAEKAVLSRYLDRTELLQELLRPYTLQLATSSTGGDLTHPEKSQGIIQESLRWAAFLQKMGSRHLLITTGTREIFNSIRADFKLAADTLNELGRHCSDYDLILCIHPRRGDRVENEEEIDRMMNLVDTRDVFLCLDTGNLTQSNVDSTKIITTYTNCIRHVYFQDVFDLSPEEMEAESYIPEPGKGKVDFLKVKNALESISYRDWITVVADEKIKKAYPYAERWKSYLNNILQIEVKS